MSQRKTKDYDFHIVTCQGKPVTTVRLRLPKDAEVDTYSHEVEAIRKAGLRQHVCDGCYDQAYHVGDVVEAPTSKTRS